MTEHEKAQLRLACVGLALARFDSATAVTTVIAYAKALADFAETGQVAPGEP